MFKKLSSIFMGLMWRLSNLVMIRPPSSRERAAEEVQDLQRERMRLVLSLMDHKAALDSVERKLQVMTAIMDNDVNDNIFETLAGLELASEVRIQQSKPAGMSAIKPDLAGNIAHLRGSDQNTSYTTIRR